MRSFKAAGMAAVAFVLAIAAAPASAAIEVGNGCEATFLLPDQSFLSLKHGPSNPVPAVIPQAGVITGWKIRISGHPGMTVRLLRGRAMGAPTPFRVLAESDPGTVADGLNTFSARLPVQAGDLIGLSGHLPTGAHETPLCNEVGGAIEFLQDAGSGQPNTTEGEFTGLQVPVVAVLEPDADGDGFGDETQDQCPTDPAAHGPCIVVNPPSHLILTARAKVKLRAIVVTATPSATASILVTGAVRLKKGAKPLRLKAPRQDVAANATGRFKLKLPARLRKRLAALPRRRSLIASLTVRAAGSTPALTAKETLKVKLKGRARS
jgi:hypothetical protein